MPSKPLFGMPVAVGMSEAVIPIRSIVSAAAGAERASEPQNATARQAGRMLMRALLYTRRPFAQQEAGQRIFWANGRPAPVPFDQSCGGCIRFDPPCPRSTFKVPHAHLP